jgi:hypothetical protein
MPNFDSSYGRFYQLGYVTRDIDVAVANLERRMAARRIDLIHDLRDEAGRPAQLLHVAHLALPGVELEIMEPRLDWPSIYLEDLPESPGAVRLHHLGYVLPDVAAWDRAVTQLSRMATPIVLQFETSQVKVAYFDTRQQTGHYSEIVLRFHPETARALPQ